MERTECQGMMLPHWPKGKKFKGHYWRADQVKAPKSGPEVNFTFTPAPTNLTPDEFKAWLCFADKLPSRFAPAVIKSLRVKMGLDAPVRKVEFPKTRDGENIYFWTGDNGGMVKATEYYDCATYTTRDGETVLAWGSNEGFDPWVKTSERKYYGDAVFAHLGTTFEEPRQISHMEMRVERMLRIEADGTVTDASAA